MAQKPSSYAISRRAAADLDGIYDYSVQKWSLDRTERYLRDLRETIVAITAGTKVGRDAGLEISVMQYRVSKHIVFYRLTPSVMIVDRVLHVSMDAPRHLGG